MIQRPSPYTNAIVSSWETGKRKPTLEAAQAMSQLFDATTEYILGTSNVIDEDSTDIELSALSQSKLSYDDLSAYHGLPVYITFPNMDNKDCWGLCRCDDTSTIKIITVNETIEITRNNISSYDIYPRELDNANADSAKKRNNLGIIQILQSTKPVYVQMKTSNIEVKSAYDGWYRVTKDGNFLQGDSGRVLPISGLHITYNCYADI